MTSVYSAVKSSSALGLVSTGPDVGPGAGTEATVTVATVEVRLVFVVSLGRWDPWELGALGLQ